MSLFQLDPTSLAARSKGQQIPSRSAMIWRGIIGFTLVSLAGFAPWACFGSWFRGHGGELGMYLVCALVFIGLSGPLLHRLILGNGSLSRFYKLFSLAFSIYALGWIAGWMLLRGHLGSTIGLLAGTAGMGWIIATAFDAKREALKIIAALFLLNAAGYFLGGIIEEALVKVCECSGGTVIAKPTQMLIAKLQWGLCYGIGFGAGLGLAFHLAQKHARQLA